jgi:decaprenylphospho-beta-D-erythro-pentofuranosid-2-ulose 2-reductase
VIFGATSAIAAATARLWVAQGCDVFLIGRNASKLAALKTDLLVRGATGQRIDTMQADLNELDCHANLFACVERTLGGLDTVLIAHGSLPDQKACEQSVETMLSEIHTNALSAISLLSHAANHFEAKGCGTIAAISSVAGDRGRQSNYVYGAAKGMLTLFMQGLRNRLYQHGVAVVTIKPGFVDTPMTAAFDKGGLLWAQPESIARGIVKAVEQGRDVVYLPWWWRWILLIIRHIPERIFKRLSL